MSARNVLADETCDAIAGRVLADVVDLTAPVNINRALIRAGYAQAEAARWRGMSYPWGEPNDGPHGDDDTKSADLIAAAPELYEALRNLLAAHEGDGGTLPNAAAIARAALAKANR